METPKNLLGNPIGNPKFTPPQKPFNSSNSGTPLNSQKSSLSSTVKFVIIFVAGLLIGAIVLWFALGSKKEALPEDNLVTTETSEGTDKGNQSDLNITEKSTPAPVAVSGSNAIAANDQPAGNIAEVTMITLSVPGWVVIHEDKNGTLGNVLGAGRFDPGIHLGEIELLRGTVSGGTYHAVLYQDNGDRQFNMSDDAPIKNAEGKIIEATFKAE